MKPDTVWTRVQKRGPSDCWPWLGRTTEDGYGQGDAGGTSFLAHRAAFFLAQGFMWPEQNVMHGCDNPRCCNPAHLSGGTHAENMADMKAKGRRRGICAGTENGRAKLTSAEVAAMRLSRENGALLKDLARAYGVGTSTVARICKGECYK